MLTQALDEVERRREQRQAQQPPQPTTPEPPPADPFGGKPDDDWVTVADARRWASDFLDRNFQQRLQPYQQAMTQLYKMQVGTLEQNSRMANSETWQRWGSEIRDIIKKREQIKTIEASDYDEAIAIVKGRHADEIAEQRLQQMMKNVPTTETGSHENIGPDSRGGDDYEEVPESWKRLWSEQGITRRMIQDAARKMGYSEKEYIEMLKRGEVTRDDRAFVRTGLTDNESG